MKRVIHTAPLRFLRRLAELYVRYNIPRAAAELAYYLILAFFPVLICLNYLLGEVELDPATILNAANTIFPRDALSVLEDYLAYVAHNQSPALLLAGLTMALASGAAAFRGLMHIGAEIHGVVPRKGLGNLALSFVFALLMLPAMYLSLAMVVTGGWFVGLLERSSDLFLFLRGWSWVRYLILFVLLFVFVYLAYRVTTPRRRPHTPVIRGALAATVGMVALSMLFSELMSQSTRYELVYGSLTSVIVLLVWLYACANVLILGNVVNYLDLPGNLPVTEPQTGK